MSLYPAVDKLLEKYQSMYNPEKHVVDIHKADWSYFMWEGVDLEQIDAETMDCLLSGRLTGVVQVNNWYGNKKKYTAKLRIYKDEHGKLTHIIIPATDERYIPDALFNYTLSESEKDCLRNKGRLDESIWVVIEKSKQLILPFIDKETNQIMYRSMNQVKLPKEYNGVKLEPAHIKDLIYGKSVSITVGNQSELIFINPQSGELQSDKKEDNKRIDPMVVRKKLPFFLHDYMREQQVKEKIKEAVNTSIAGFYDLKDIYNDYVRAGFDFNIDKLKRLYIESFNDIDPETIVKRYFYEALLKELNIDTKNLILNEYGIKNTKSGNSNSAENNATTQQAATLSGGNEQNNRISGRNSIQSRSGDSSSEGDGLANIALVSQADIHFDLWFDGKIDDVDYVVTGLSRDYIRSEYAANELAKQIDFLQTSKDTLFTEMTYQDLERSMEEKDKVGGNSFKTDFIELLIDKLTRIQYILYDDYDNKSTRAASVPTLYLNDEECLEYLEYEMFVGKNADLSDNVVKVTIYFSYRSGGGYEICLENRIEAIYIEDAKLPHSKPTIHVKDLDYNHFYEAIYNYFLTDADRKIYDENVLPF